MKELVEQVNILVVGELERANYIYPLFQSTHEGHGVILEEIEEVEEDFDMVVLLLKKSWYLIKKNENTNKEMETLKKYATRLSAEAIQVAAMAQKFIDSEVCR